MLRKLGIAGAVAGIALGSVLAAAPAQADINASEQQYNQNLQAIPIGVCNNNIAALIGVNVPVLSPQTSGDCASGGKGTNVSL
ncbi:hypothetical protein [Marinactinospora rubrisoli]|uniref:Chaplin domain-containing protein n=1 Tax=Marinactinospora rubrisoli TaxID=2715399 RepID=A0ABW2KJF4_9ACTN